MGPKILRVAQVKPEVRIRHAIAADPIHSGENQTRQQSGERGNRVPEADGQFRRFHLVRHRGFPNPWLHFRLVHAAFPKTAYCPPKGTLRSADSIPPKAR